MARRPALSMAKPTLNIAKGGFSSIQPDRRRNLDLNFAVRSSDRENSETDSRFNEIMKSDGNITINGIVYKTAIEHFEQLEELGYGTSGHVVKMCHRPSNKIIAVKQMRRSGNMDENKRIIMDLEVVLKSHDCPFIVKCLGCIITDSDVWICMELMSTCMDKLLKKLKEPIPEFIIGKVAVATVKALNYLKDTHGVIHRDVKPSNILLDEHGIVKLCDFGISGRLVESKAKTRSAGCTAYMAPERIDPPDPTKPNYDIRADVWSLGITLVELATGRFPYTNCQNDFEVMTRILNDPPPMLPRDSKFSDQFHSFVNECLRKNYKDRPKYNKLLVHEFIRINEAKAVDVRTWFNLVVSNGGGSRKIHPYSSSASFPSRDGRPGGRNKSTSGLGSPAGFSVLTSTSPSASSGRQGRYEEFAPPRSSRNFDRLNSEPLPSRSTGSAHTTPGTPSPNSALVPPDPPPRYSRMNSEGLRTPTPNSSSSGASSSSGFLSMASPSSVANSSPSPPGPEPRQLPPMRRYIQSATRLFFTPEPTRKRFFEFTHSPH